MNDIIDDSYFIELAGQKPADICRQALCSYDSAKAVYTGEFWTDKYTIDPKKLSITGVNNDFKPVHEYFYLFIIYYLLKGKEINLSGEWISDKDIPGGSTFFRGPHDIPTNLICNRFNNDIDAFKKRCRQLQGTSVAMGDAAFTFRIAPRIPVTVLYWLGDDDFPPEAKILYDKSISEHLTLDIIFALAVEICTRIGQENRRLDDNGR